MLRPKFVTNLPAPRILFYKILLHTDGSRILHTLILKHYNDFDLLDRLNSERGKDEVTYFSVGDVFCIHLGTKYAGV